MNSTQAQKAEKFLALHHSGKLLILPNIWDVIGVRMLEFEGFQAAATASAAVAYSNGLHDGEHISFSRLLNILKDICDNTSLPVSADIERGYAENIEELKNNTAQLIKSGIVGINIEDSDEHKNLIPVDQQCEKIQAVRKVSDSLGVHVVINARTDIFLSKDFEGNKIHTAVERARLYMDAGADCFYPILCSNEEVTDIRFQLKIPINVIATKDTLPMKKLEEIGIARLSLGPALLRAVLTKMKSILNELKAYKDYGSFTGSEVLTSQDIWEMLG